MLLVGAVPFLPVQPTASLGNPKPPRGQEAELLWEVKMLIEWQVRNELN
ncbi:MAG: hypothetical protein AB7P24_17575 [Nitrospira sp.]